MKMHEQAMSASQSLPNQPREDADLFITRPLRERGAQRLGLRRGAAGGLRAKLRFWSTARLSAPWQHRLQWTIRGRGGNQTGLFESHGYLRGGARGQLQRAGQFRAAEGAEPQE